MSRPIVGEFDAVTGVYTEREMTDAEYETFMADISRNETGENMS